MTRRRLLLALGGALAVLVATIPAVWRARLPIPMITEANCSRIKVGMRKGEVEALLGGPPGYYHGGRFIGRSVPCDTGISVLESWADDEGTAVIRFGHDGAVIEVARFDPAHEPEPTVFQQLIALLRHLIPLTRKHAGGGSLQPPPASSFQNRPVRF